MFKRRFSGEQFDEMMDNLEIEDVPGFKESGWVKKAYELAK
jgi:hypothetical protein